MCIYAHEVIVVGHWKTPADRFPIWCEWCVYKIIRCLKLKLKIEVGTVRSDDQRSGVRIDDVLFILVAKIIDIVKDRLGCIFIAHRRVCSNLDLHAVTDAIPIAVRLKGAATEFEKFCAVVEPVPIGVERGVIVIRHPIGIGIRLSVSVSVPGK